MALFNEREFISGVESAAPQQWIRSATPKVKSVTYVCGHEQRRGRVIGVRSARQYLKLVQFRKAMRYSRLVCILTCISGLFLGARSPLLAQAIDEIKAVKIAEKNSNQATNSLQVQSNIPDTARVHALLMPPRVVEQVFGKRVAQEYAVVEVDIFNLSKDAALMVGDISVDYSQWIFASCPTEDDDDPETKAKAERKAAKAAKMVGVFIESPPCEVSSQEVRAVRQIALEGQRGTWRNRVARYLRGLGIAGGALGVANLGKALPATMSAFTNGVIPGFEFAFPDGTIDQINLLNDLAYRVNTVVPQESPRVVMAFFPMRRFLGSYFWKKYLEEPALFFSPMQYYFDRDFDDFFKHVQERATSFYKEKAKTDLLLAANGPLVPPLLRLSINQLIDQMAATDKAVKDLAAAKLAVLGQALHSASGGSLNDLPVILQMQAYDLLNTLIAADTDQKEKDAAKELLNFAVNLQSLQALSRLPETDRNNLREAIIKLRELLDKNKDFTSGPFKSPEVTQFLSQAKENLKSNPILQAAVSVIVPLLFEHQADAATFLSQFSIYLAQQAPTQSPQNEVGSTSNAPDISNPDFTLNAVHIKVDAKFVTNIDNVAAQIDSVTFDNITDEKNMALFSAANNTTGVIHGHFLDKGTPNVASSDGPDHGLKITAVPDGSNAENLKFTLSWTDSIPSGTGLIFTVTKTVGTPAKGQTTSNSFTKQITYPDFTITAIPGSLTATAGGTPATYTINPAAINGFTDIITLDVSGLPPEVDSSFTPVGSSSTSNETRPGIAMSLKISPKPSAKAGTYTPIISGRSKGPAVEASSANKKPTDATGANEPASGTGATGNNPAPAAKRTTKNPAGKDKTPAEAGGANTKPAAGATDTGKNGDKGKDTKPAGEVKDLVRTVKVTLLVNR